MAQRRMCECKHRVCMNLTRNKTGYCEEHEGEYIDKINKQKKEWKIKSGYKRTGPRTDIDKFYSSKQWQELRLYVLARDNYLCQDCLKQGTITEARQVHHIQTILTQWDKRFDEDNLISLCKEHHELRHGKGTSNGC